MKNGYGPSAIRGSIVIAISIISIMFYAFSTGITGRTPKNGAGCTCHAETPTSSVIVQITGPDTLQFNQTAVYSVTISGGPLQRAGTNIAASQGILANLGPDLQVIGDELTHTEPKLPSGGTVTFSFNYTAPAIPGNRTLYAAANSVNFNGNNSGDEWNFAANKTVVVVPAIPVELTSFTADISGGSVILNWSTATESNNSGFEIQRSSDKSEWNAISFVKGSGTSTETKNYSYTDAGLKTGVYFYRLRQVDYNGTSALYELSTAAEITQPAGFSLAQNYPNPFNPSTLISFVLSRDQNISLKLFNALGKEVAVLYTGNMSAGRHSIELNTRDTKSFSSGVYFYELAAEEGRLVRKMILNK